MTPVSAPLLANGSVVTGASAPGQGGERARLAEAAKAFEAIFVRQMLASARQASFGEPLLGGQGLETFRSMQDSHFADLAAGTGALGLAKQIEAQLARHLPPAGA
ncbi:MAG: rod-binding protein [Sphingomonadaceae bacterium]|jgi:peptidoglycan hydrolase FlgJ|nr:rod-binding protein [Sphingomonadaceae bacterium]